MKKLLLAVFLSALAAPAWASCTAWAQGDALSYSLTCTTGNESAPSTVADGASLELLSSGFGVVAEADSGQTFTATPGGTLRAWLWDDSVGAWSRCPDLDLTFSAASERRQAWAGFSTTSYRGRIAYQPVSVTLSSGGLKVYINGSRRY